MTTLGDMQAKFTLPSGSDIIDRLTRHVSDAPELVDFLYPQLALFLGSQPVRAADLVYRVNAIIVGARPNLGGMADLAVTYRGDILRQLTATDPNFAATVEVELQDIFYHQVNQGTTDPAFGFLGS